MIGEVGQAQKLVILSNAKDLPRGPESGSFVAELLRMTMSHRSSG